MTALPFPESETMDLDLGDNHFLQYIASPADGHPVGGLLWHCRPRPAQDNETPWCAGSVFWETVPGYGNHPLWTKTGDGAELTLSPSVLCGCGDHGFIRSGKWVRA